VFGLGGRQVCMYVCMYASLYDFFGSPLVGTELDNLWIYSSHFDCVVTKAFLARHDFLFIPCIHTYIHTYILTDFRTRTNTNTHERARMNTSTLKHILSVLIPTLSNGEFDSQLVAKLASSHFMQ
jgi:hypothetical protein